MAQRIHTSFEDNGHDVQQLRLAWKHVTEFNLVSVGIQKSDICVILWDIISQRKPWVIF